MRVSECVDEIAYWMGANCFKLNTEKFDVIWFSSRWNLKIIPSYSDRVLESNIFPSKSVKSLGISMDRDLTMSMPISKTIQTCFTSQRQIRSIKGCLTMDSLETLASALVLSCIDSGNMALVSLPKVATQNIQSIINTTARLITGVKKHDHIIPVPKELHWLKIDERIEYKIALQMSKCLSNEDPAYLTRDLVPVASLPEKQRLRSAKSCSKQAQAKCSYFIVLYCTSQQTPTANMTTLLKSVFLLACITIRWFSTLSKILFCRITSIYGIVGIFFGADWLGEVMLF